MIVWDYYSKKKQRIAEAFPDILQQCETVLENLWLIMFALVETLKKEGKRLSPVQTFNLIFFQRNIAYLISAYKLAEQGLVNPTRNVTRTIYEQILRSHLFLHDPDEAKLWDDYYQLPDGEDVETIRREIRRRRYWNHGYMKEKMYEGSVLEQHENFYEIISWFSHPHIKSTISDYEKITEVEDTLRGILGLSHSTIDVMEETFNDIYGADIEDLCRVTKQFVGAYLGDIPVFRPNKPLSAS